MATHKFVVKSAATPYMNVDKSLLKDREVFKKRALEQPTIEKKEVTVDESAAKITKPEESFKKPKSLQRTFLPKLDATNYKSMAGSSQYRFAVLAKIVKHMRSRHQDGDLHPLTIEEILDETNQLDIMQTVKSWLVTEALVNNPKIEVVNSTEGIRFAYKPVYNIRDGKTLIRLLKQYDLRGIGGIMLEDVQESLPHCEKVLKSREKEILYVTRPVDKKKILFYNDKSIEFSIDEEFKQLWRSSTVDALDDTKIEEYLEKQGISSMRGENQKLVHKRPKQTKTRQSKKPRDNEHLADVLEIYDNDMKITNEKSATTK